MVRSLCLTLAAASLTAAHFTLNWPPTAGFDDDNEPNAPCGGATVVVNDTAPEIHVGQFAVQIFSSHPAGSWSFAATTDTAEPYDFTAFAAVNTTGVGNFCLHDFTIPSEYAGQTGVLQVIDDSVDGLLYQCAPVRFVTGSNSTVGPSCTNQTSGFDATWSATETANSSETTSVTSAAASASATADASSSSSAGAAMVTGVGSVLGLGLLVAGVVL